jgi:two-component system invasion response regulator UvrY
MINILVVDDHALIRKGLKQLLEDSPDLQITGEAASGIQAVTMLRAQHFDLMLLDINLPDKHGIEVLKQFKSEQPGLKIIVLSMYPEDHYGVRALKAGAMGYINKQSASDVLIKAIRQVVSGKKYISETLAEQLLNNLIGESQELMHQNLSNREYQTLCLMAERHFRDHDLEPQDSKRLPQPHAGKNGLHQQCRGDPLRHHPSSGRLSGLK